MSEAPDRDLVDRIVEEWLRERPDLDHATLGIVARLLRIAEILNAEEVGGALVGGASLKATDFLPIVRAGG